LFVFGRSYAVYWREGEGPRHTGKVQLGRLHLLLKGGRGARLAVPCEEIESVDYRGREILLARRNQPSVRIGSLDGPGALLELLELTSDVRA
jgi:hypothetical protein